MDAIVNDPLLMGVPKPCCDLHRTPTGFPDWELAALRQHLVQWRPVEGFENQKVQIPHLLKATRAGDVQVFESGGQLACALKSFEKFRVFSVGRGPDVERHPLPGATILGSKCQPGPENADLIEHLVRPDMESLVLPLEDH